MSRRASVVLPEAEGPTTASTSPGLSANVTPRRICAVPPGAPAISGSTWSTPRGAGSGMPSPRSGTARSNWSSRAQASRAFTTDCHCDTACTSGATTRPPNTEAMIIITSPPLSVPCKNSQQPSPSRPELSVVCSNFETAWYPPAASEACACKRKNSRCLSIQRA